MGYTEKKKQKPRGIAADQMQDGADAEAITTIVRFMEAITPKDTEVRNNDAEWIKERFAFYLWKCSEFGLKPNNRTFYVSIGMTHQRVNECILYTKTNPERAEALKICLERLAGIRELLMQQGQIPTIAGIFWQKNYDGLRDQAEVIVKDRSAIEDGLSMKQLSDKYRDELSALDCIVDGEVTEG